jgi:hypothetical protein
MPNRTGRTSIRQLGCLVNRIVKCTEFSLQVSMAIVSRIGGSCLNLNFFAHFAAFPLRTSRSKALPLGPNQKTLTAKYAKKKPQSARRNSG